MSVPYIAKTEVNPQTGENKTALLDPYADNPEGMIHPPIPNAWLLDHGQDILSGNVLDQDSDGDGFTTLDEWIGKTDTQDPK